MTAILPWWWRWAALAAFAVALVAFGWFKGNAHGTQKLLDYQGKQATETVKLAAARTVVLTKVETKWRTVERKIFVQGETIEKEVIRHVTVADDSRCTVPLGFVRVYDAALANNPDTGPAGADERAPSGIPLSVVAETDAFNWKLANAWKARAGACIEAYNAVKNAK